MLHEFAVTPGVFGTPGKDEEKDVKHNLLSLLNGILKHGLLTDLDSGGWRREVLRQSGSLPFAIKGNVQALLNKIVDRGLLIARPRKGLTPPTRDVDWLNEAVWQCFNLPSPDPFHAIVTKSSTKANVSPLPDHVISLNDLSSCDRWTECQQSRKVLKSSDDFKRFLKPILSTATRICLIDPYFVRLHSSSRYQRALTTIYACTTGNVKLRSLEIHTCTDCDINGNEKNFNEYTPLLKAKLAELFPCIASTGIERKFHIWRERVGGRRFHNRYVVTNHTGIVVPHGLDLDSDACPNTDHWSIMEYSDSRTVISNLGIDFEAAGSAFVW